MKRTLITSAVVAVLGFGSAALADHTKDCKGIHGTVTAKSGNSISVDGKAYTVDSAQVMREGGTSASLAAVNTGDKVCIETSPSANKQVSRVLVMNSDAHASANATVKEPTVRDTAKAKLEKARTYASEKLSDLERETHEKMCKGNHGTITDKTANSLTIDGKQYAFKINTPVNKQEEPLLPKITKVGDRVCFTTMKAADGTQQLDKLIALDKETDTKVRVREKTTDDDVEIKAKASDDKVKIETDDTKVKIDADDRKVEVK
jgi:hypothetical protein